jgi:hypothetical protein
MQAGPPENPLWKKLAWFAALWAGGVLAVTLAALLVRAAIPG